MSSKKLKRLRKKFHQDPSKVLRNIEFSFGALKNAHDSLKSSSAGIDGVIKDDFLDEDISDLIQEITSGEYQPSTVLERKEGEKKPYYISCHRDKVIQKFIAQILYICFVSDLEKYGYSYSCKGKGAHEGLKKIHEYIREYQGESSILRLDISNHYGSIDVDILMQIVESKIVCPVFLDLLRNYLSSKVKLVSGSLEIIRGILRGSVLGAILSEIYTVFAIDKAIYKVKSLGKFDLDYIRYADDMLFFTRKDSIDVKKLYGFVERRAEKYCLYFKAYKKFSVVDLGHFMESQLESFDISKPAAMIFNVPVLYNPSFKSISESSPGLIERTLKMECALSLDLNKVCEVYEKISYFLDKVLKPDVEIKSVLKELANRYTSLFYWWNSINPDQYLKVIKKISDLIYSKLLKAGYELKQIDPIIEEIPALSRILISNSLDQTFEEAF